MNGGDLWHKADRIHAPDALAGESRGFEDGFGGVGVEREVGNGKLDDQVEPPVAVYVAEVGPGRAPSNGAYALPARVTVSGFTVEASNAGELRIAACTVPRALRLIVLLASPGLMSMATVRNGLKASFNDSGSLPLKPPKT